MESESAEQARKGKIKEGMVRGNKNGEKQKGMFKICILLQLLIVECQKL